ncbi:MAG: hypothetical protein U0X20_20145 [Caldilineaceae bacterium]
MSNSNSRKSIPPKQSDSRNNYQAFLLVSSLIGTLALVVAVFLSSSHPAQAEVRNGVENAGVPDVAAAPTAVMTGTMVMTDATDMAGMDMAGTSMTATVTSTMAGMDMTGMDMTGMDMADASMTATMTSTMAGMDMSGMDMTGTVTGTDVMTDSMSHDAVPATHVAATPSATVAITASGAATGTATGTPEAGNALSPTVMLTAPTASTANEEVQGLMQDVLLLVRSHNARMQKMLTGTPTANEVAAMNADMQVLTRMMQRLIALTQGQSTAALFPQANLSDPNAAMPPMGTAGVMTATGTMTGMAGMDMSGMNSAPVAPMAPMTVPTGTTAMQMPGAAQPSVDQQLQTITVLMQEARQQMQTMMANGASAAEIEQMRAKLEQVRYLMRDVLAQMQAGAGPAPATLDSPIAGAASAATANSGMMGNMSAMMDNMSSMMNSMMGGMGGSAAGASGPAMPGAAAVDPAIAALTRAAEAGGVTITVVPQNLSDPAASTLDFHVKVDTHTVALDQNLGSLSVLRASSGAWAPAVQWNGPTGGHHVEGTLSFPRTDRAGTALAVPGSTLTLSIRDFGGIADRSFTWNLGQ